MLRTVARGIDLVGAIATQIVDSVEAWSGISSGSEGLLLIRAEAAPFEGNALRAIPGEHDTTGGRFRGHRGDPGGALAGLGGDTSQHTARIPVDVLAHRQDVGAGVVENGLRGQRARPVRRVIIRQEQLRAFLECGVLIDVDRARSTGRLRRGCLETQDFVNVARATGRTGKAEAEAGGEGTVGDLLIRQDVGCRAAVVAVRQAQQAILRDLEVVQNRDRIGARHGRLVRDLHTCGEGGKGGREGLIVRHSDLRAAHGDCFVVVVGEIAVRASVLHGKGLLTPFARGPGGRELGGIVLVEPGPGNVAGSAQADAVRILAAAGRGVVAQALRIAHAQRVDATVEEVAEFIDTKAKVAADQSVVRIVAVRAAVTQTTTERTESRGLAAIHEEEAHSVGTVVGMGGSARAVTTLVATIGECLEGDLHTLAGGKRVTP